MRLLKAPGIAVASLLLLGCDINGGGQVYPGASVYEAPDQGFHFHFLAPPWRYHEKDPKHLVHLVVDSFSQFKRSDPVTISHKLFVGYDPATNLKSRIAVLRNLAIKDGQTISTDIESITTLTGEEGWQYLAHKNDAKGGRFYYRESLLADANGRAVLFKLIAAYPLDEQDLDDLVHSFSAGPDDGTETPPVFPDGGPADGSATDGGGP